jgi:hypothetical protein
MVKSIINLMKAVRDPLHGYIELDDITLALVDTRKMQRLRRIRQLGFAYLVYPGANHTRFEHSLGTYHLASILLRRLDIEDDEIRVAALLHDVGHGPYSHATEDILYEHTGEGHEDVIEDGNIMEILERYSLSVDRIKKCIKGESQILGGDIDVDRMDYLVRDAYYTGVAFGLVDYLRLIHEMEIFDGELVVKFGGIQAIESLLVSRFLMYPTVYFHHVSRIAESMFTRALERMISYGSIDPMRLREMDDCELNMEMRSSKGYVNEIMERIKNRRLFKRALYVGVNLVDIDPLNARKIEEEISETIGIDDGYVIVDVPKIPKNKETDVKVMLNGEIKMLEDLSPIISVLKRSERENWRVGVYTPEEYRKKVEKIAKDLLNIC